MYRHAMIATLSIPHLLKEIVASLTPHDLTKCTQVSSTWNAFFEPSLWHTLTLTNQWIIGHLADIPSSSSSSPLSPYTTQTGLKRNRHSVRSISIHAAQVFDTALFLDNPFFPSLVYFEFKCIETYSKLVPDLSILSKMLRLLDCNRSLRTVVLHSYPLDHDLSARMLADVLGKHQGIEELTVHGAYHARWSSVLYILQGVLRSPCLRALKLISPLRESRVRSSPSSHQVTLPSEGLLSYFQDHKCLPTTPLKRLLLDLHLEDSEYYTALLVLLKKSPHLERLCFISPLSRKEAHHSELSSTLQQFCSKLQHLELVNSGTNNTSHNNEDKDDDDSTADILQACSGHLHSLTLRSTAQQHTITGDRSIETLAHHQHSRTLERLDFRKGFKIKSKQLQLLLTSCPNLKSMVAMDTESCSVIQAHVNQSWIHVEDLVVSSQIGRLSPAFGCNASSSGAWVCRGLRELQIGFTGFSTLTSDESAQYYSDLIYNQLSVLTELRILHLASGSSSISTSFPTDTPLSPNDNGSFDFSLKSGLKKLVTLKYLRRLNLSLMKHLRIGMKEAAWMNDNWKALAFVAVPAQDVSSTPGEYRAAVNLFELTKVQPTLTVSVSF